MNLARTLCWFGFHQPVVTHPGVDLGWYHESTGQTLGTLSSAQGFCARCDKPYNWDI